MSEYSRYLRYDCAMEVVSGTRIHQNPHFWGDCMLPGEEYRT